METLKFKTNIKCSGCVGKATPYLNNIAGDNNWEVDVQNPDKILTVISGGTVNPEEIIKAVQESGYKAESLP
jgi:copper chaperone CopZ